MRIGDAEVKQTGGDCVRQCAPVTARTPNHVAGAQGEQTLCFWQLVTKAIQAFRNAFTGLEWRLTLAPLNQPCASRRGEARREPLTLQLRVCRRPLKSEEIEQSSVWG